MFGDTNIVMSKKISILGRGTAGCISSIMALAVKNAHSNDRVEIDWYYDPSTPASSVGEGTTPNFTDILKMIGQTSNDLSKYDARPKIGISYENWGQRDFDHPFSVGNYGIHFNATKFQQKVFDGISGQGSVTVIPKSVTHDEIDADLIVDCRGRPKDLTDYRTPKYIPVNAVHVVQCNWKSEPKWLHTKTIARKWGWVFVIPLLSRCSVGYLYNHDISSLDQVKDDIAEVIRDLDVVASDKTNSFVFDNYVRNKLIDGRAMYAGNSGFFLEPMEATTLDGVLRVVDNIEGCLYNPQFDETYENQMLHMFFYEVEFFIMMHYASGSKWSNEFWEFAQDRGRAALDEALSLPLTKKFYTLGQVENISYNRYFATESYDINLTGLGLKHDIGGMAA